MTELTPQRWELVQTIFEHAADLTDGARRSYLEESCADDPTLRQEVESLLATEEGIDRFLSKPTRPELDNHEHDAPQIDRYRILERLGAGGMGVVFLAERADDTFHQQVAVKVIKRGLDTDEFVRRFRVERQTLATLQHPNIARLIDGGASADGRPYLVIEYIDGRPIDAFCEQRELPVRERIALFAKVCDAVAHAHRSLVVHRDLKPSNVLVDASGEPKLLDFGVAKVIDPQVAGGSFAVTATGHRLMTPRYASPEQILGQPVTTATDVYSLGVLLYELLTETTPYRAETGSTAELEHCVCEQEPRRPSAATGASTDRTNTRPHSRELRGDLDTIVLKTLRKKPHERYATVDQLTADLRSYLAYEPISARPPSVGYRLTSFLRRRRTALRAAGLGLGLGVVVAAALILGLLVMPHLSARAKLDAHAILVGPDQQAAIYDAVFFRGRIGLDRVDARDQEADVAMLARVERVYDRALRFNPFDQQARRERQVVRAARLIRQVPLSAPVPIEALGMLDPEVATLMSGDVDTGSVAPPAQLRDLGLLLLLCRPSPEGIEALRTYETLVEPDPLVEGLLGQLYLALDKPDLAYPRLRAAYEAYPATRAMALGLAEAASGVRDHARALRLVEIAAELPGADPFDRLARVRAQSLAAADRLAEAHEAFEHATRPIYLQGGGGSNPVSCFAYGRFLEQHGQTDGALRFYARASCFGRQPVEMAPLAPMVAFVRLMERRIESWSDEERKRRLQEPDTTPPIFTQQVPGIPTHAPFGLSDQLQYYLDARRELLQRPPRIAIWPEEAERFAAERSNWTQETDASRLAAELGLQ